MNKSPAFQFYPNDWLSSPRIAMMTPAQEGAYIRLLAYAWNDPDCGIPDDDKVLAHLSRLGDGWFDGGSLLVKGCFSHHPTVPGKLVNFRLLSEREKQVKWREKSSEGGRKSAEARSLKVRKGASGVVEPKANSSSSCSSSVKEESKDSSSREEIEQESVKFADWFKKLLADTGDHREIRDTDLKEWANCYGLMVRRDNRTKREITEVCKWARSDPFWSMQIRSPRKLRKRDDDGVMYYDVLLGRMTTTAAKDMAKTPSPPPPAYPPNWQELRQQVAETTLSEASPEFIQEELTAKIWNELSFSMQTEIIRIWNKQG